MSFPNFELPTIGLARQPKGAAASRQYALIHGNTDEMALEHRRLQVSGRLRCVERAIESTILEKKAKLLALDRKITALRKRDAAEGTADQIAELENEKIIVVGELDARSAAFNIEAGHMEIGCLQFDALSIRDLAENKETGKKGLARFTVAGYAEHIETLLVEILRLLAEVHGKPEIIKFLEEEKSVGAGDIVDEKERAEYNGGGQ